MISGIVLDSGYYSLKKVIKNSLENHFGVPFLVSGLATDMINTRIETLLKININKIVIFLITLFNQMNYK